MSRFRKLPPGYPLPHAHRDDLEFLTHVRGLTNLTETIDELIEAQQNKRALWKILALQRAVARLMKGE